MKKLLTEKNTKIMNIDIDKVTGGDPVKKEILEKKLQIYTHEEKNNCQNSARDRYSRFIATGYSMVHQYRLATVGLHMQRSSTIDIRYRT